MLCDCEIALIIRNEDKVTQYSSHDLEMVLQSYQDHEGDVEVVKTNHVRQATGSQCDFCVQLQGLTCWYRSFVCFWQHESLHPGRTSSSNEVHIFKKRSQLIGNAAVVKAITSAAAPSSVRFASNSADGAHCERPASHHRRISSSDNAFMADVAQPVSLMSSPTLPISSPFTSLSDESSPRSDALFGFRTVEPLFGAVSTRQQYEESKQKATDLDALQQVDPIHRVLDFNEESAFDYLSKIPDVPQPFFDDEVLSAPAVAQLPGASADYLIDSHTRSSPSASCSSSDASNNYYASQVFLQLAESVANGDHNSSSSSAGSKRQRL